MQAWKDVSQIVISKLKRNKCLRLVAVLIAYVVLTQEHRTLTPWHSRAICRVCQFVAEHHSHNSVLERFSRRHVEKCESSGAVSQGEAVMGPVKKGERRKGNKKDHFK